MAQFRIGGNGMISFENALALAPFDRRAVEYAVIGHLTLGTKESHAAGLDLLAAERHLFAPDELWYLRATRLLKQSP